MGNMTDIKDKTTVKKPRLMLTCKIMLILTLVTLYVMQGFVYFTIKGVLSSMTEFSVLDLIVPLALLGVSTLLGITALVLGITGAVKNEGPVSVITVVVKVLMIPFFVVNFLLWFFVIGGMLNPFLMLGIPVAAFIGICLTYGYMLMTSLPDIVYTMIFCIRNKRTAAPLMVIGVIFEFIFMLDLVGSIMLHKAYKDILEYEE